MIDLAHILVLSRKDFVSRSVRASIEPDRSCRAECGKAPAAA